MTDLLDIVRQYPVKNRIWTMLDTMFVTDASNGKASPDGRIYDPWNREFPFFAVSHYNNENEITHWDVKTTVNGEEILCKIFNT